LFSFGLLPVETREQRNHIALCVNGWVNGLGMNLGVPWCIAGQARRW